MTKQLQKELLELSERVISFLDSKKDIETTGVILIDSNLELSEGVTVPYNFKCEALHPGSYKGYEIEEQDILHAKNTILESSGNFHNYEINKDHKNSRKHTSSVDDIVGRVNNYDYNRDKKAYILEGSVFNKELALKIANGIVKYVSLRVVPGKIDYLRGKKYARNLTFEELSFVRSPGDPNAKIINK